MNVTPYYLVRNTMGAKLIWHSKNLAGLLFCYLTARQIEAAITAIIGRMMQ